MVISPISDPPTAIPYFNAPVVFRIAVTAMDEERCAVYLVLERGSISLPIRF
jgi:hypothetical protein